MGMRERNQRMKKANGFDGFLVSQALEICSSL